ncbi:MAG: DUF11 domain-containing protein, partial [Anaerolineales bacterium]|nr:DUF11 domain-containing protein [Anaerolineales bacterium]
IATPGDEDPNNDQASVDVHVSPPRYDVQIGKSVNSFVPVPGSWINYFADYRNDGNSATHVWVTDTVPPGLQYVEARWGGGQEGENELLPAPTIVGDQIVWDLGMLPVGGRRWFHIQMNVDSALEPGDTITNCIEIGSDSDEDTPDNNFSCYPVTLNPSGPNLQVTKEGWWNWDGQIQYRIRFANIGTETINDVWITDTLPLSTTSGWWNMNFDWGRLVDSSQSDSELRWKLSELNPGETGEFELHANLEPEAIGQPARWYTNTIEISTPPGDIHPDDNSFAHGSFSGGEVDRIEMQISSDHGQMWGQAQPGVMLTVTTPHTQVTTSVGQPDCGECWTFDDVGPLNPGDAILVVAGDGLVPVAFTIPDPFTAQVDSDTDTVWGQVGGAGGTTIYVNPHWGERGREVPIDPSGAYSTQFSDIPRAAEGNVSYNTEIAYAQIAFHRSFRAEDLSIEVNYAHDWVNGHFPEAGHTVWITVTDGALTPKATAQVQTAYIPDWNDIGFFTEWEDWSPGPGVDIEAGDWVFASMDNGKATEVQVGDISGYLDIESDSITGTVGAPWILPQTVDIDCHPWGSGGGVDMRRYSGLLPDGNDVFECSWDDEWDITPGQQVGVSYRDPSANSVYNVFEEPQPHVWINKWADGNPASGGRFIYRIEYSNRGNGPAEETVITDTLPVGMSYVFDNSGVTAYTSSLPSGQQVITWPLGTLAPDSNAQFQLVVQVTAPASETIVNVADIATSNPYDMGEPDEKHSEWETHVQENDAQLNVGKWSWTGEPAANTEFVFVVNVCNNGSTASGPVVLTDTLHPSLTLQTWWAQQPWWYQIDRDGQALVLGAYSVPAWQCNEVYLRVGLGAASAGMQITNTATIASDSDTTSGDNEAWWEGYVRDPYVNLWLSKDWHSGQLAPGGEVRYDVRYGNSGNVPVDGVWITSTLPANTSLVEVHRYDRNWQDLGPVTPALDAGTAAWEVGTIENGEEGIYAVVVRIDPAATPGALLVHALEIGAQPVEETYDDNVISWSDELNPSGPNLRVSKQNWGWNWQGQLWYEIRVWNFGTERLEEVRISDTYPLSTTAEWNVNHGPWITATEDAPNRTITWWLEKLEPGETASIQLRANIDGGIIGQGGHTFTNTLAAPLSGDV